MHVRPVARASSDRLTLTVTEAAELLGISRALAYELAARGELPVLRLGRRIVIPARRSRPWWRRPALAPAPERRVRRGADRRPALTAATSASRSSGQRRSPPSAHHL